MMFKYPTNYIAITQYYSTTHKALDLGWNSNYGGSNMPVHAAEDGTVVAVVKNYNKTDVDTPNYGNYVKIKHNEEYHTLYAHLAYGSVTLNVGDTVKKGEQIGLMGNTGYSTGNHLHYEVYKNGNKINPIECTYVYVDQTISKNTSATKGLLFYKEESKEDDSKDLEKLQKQIDELTKENVALKKANEELTIKVNNLQKFSFSYTALKTSYYKIKLYENETLLIKDNQN